MQRGLHSKIDAVIDGEPERESDSGAAQFGGEDLAGPGRVGAHQHPRPIRIIGGPGRLGQRGQRQFQEFDVVGGGVGARVARTQDGRQCLPTRDFRPIQKRHQRMETPGMFPGSGRVFLVRMGDRDGRVSVDDQLRGQVRASTGCPRLLPRCRPGHGHRRQVLAVDTFQQPPGGRHRGNLPKQRATIPQHLDSGHRLRAGVRHQPLTRPINLDPPTTLATLHLRSAFPSANTGPSTSPASLTGQALPCISSRCHTFSMKHLG